MAPERLSALDASFLYLERPAMHMHVAALSVFDPSTRPDGRLRSEDVATIIASRIHLAPRFRQKAVSVPWNVALIRLRTELQLVQQRQAEVHLSQQRRHLLGGAEMSRREVRCT